VREAGLKVVPRVVYDWGMLNRDPDEATICRHIEQLAPLFRRNSDVIAWVQAGFYGGTGEGCRSDHGYVYGDPNSGGWQRLSRAGAHIHRKWLHALPQDRMMTVRYPRLKWDLLGGKPDGRPRADATAFDGSDASRVGYYSDGFMGDDKHYAMYQLPGESDYAAADAEYVVQEGEISDATEYKLRAGQVVIDMVRYHQTALNCGGDGWRGVSEVWKSRGDYAEIARRMGYRFRLVRATLPRAARPGGAFDLVLDMANDGFARPINPREFQIALRGRGATYRLRLDHGRGNRLWFPGPGETARLAIAAGLPAAMPEGTYEVLLNLPDSAPTLAGRPEYSLRLANQGVWEEATGLNSLRHRLEVTRQAGGPAYTGNEVFSAG
jgi:hypothetical protein